MNAQSNRPEETNQNAGPVRRDADASVNFTASSAAVRPDRDRWPAPIITAWLDDRFGRPCSIQSPLNDL